MDSFCGFISDTVQMLSINSNSNICSYWYLILITQTGTELDMFVVKYSVSTKLPLLEE